MVFPTTGSITVDTVALDDFLCNCPTAIRNRISLIKMDIEGAEPLALEAWPSSCVAKRAYDDFRAGSKLLYFQ